MSPRKKTNSPKKANERRIALLGKKFEEGLTEEEERELEHCTEVVRKAWPRVTSAMWKKLVELERHIVDMERRNKSKKSS
jgi:hypothetical protein